MYTKVKVTQSKHTTVTTHKNNNSHMTNTNVNNMNTKITTPDQVSIHIQGVYGLTVLYLKVYVSICMTILHTVV